MKLWKQIILSAALFASAFLAWVYFDPGAREILARIGARAGIELPQSAGNAATDPAQAGSQGTGRDNGALVITEPVGQTLANDRFSAIGTGSAIRSVSVQPQVSGQIASLDIRSGANVEKGDVLVRLDSELAEIAVERARLALEDAEDRLERAENLLSQRTISSVEADLARTGVDTARLQLRQAEFDLSQRTITAPISGVVGILEISPGDYVTSQSVLSVIDDRENILVDFWVPERLVGAIEVGSPVTASTVAQPGREFTGTVIAVDNRLDEVSRTLRVQARIPNREDALRAGMSFEVTMRFDGAYFPSVDPLAIQWDSEGSYIWRVADGRAERVAVTIIQRNIDAVLIEAQIEPGDIIVIEGVQNVRHDAPVHTAEIGAPKAGT